jgi:hypothetical protein
LSHQSKFSLSFLDSPSFSRLWIENEFENFFIIRGKSRASKHEELTFAVMVSKARHLFEIRVLLNVFFGELEAKLFGSKEDF